ncbi:MAG: thioredoxin family protein [Chryseobacterium sp.]|jgi:thiol-disulfide isomerase/thioredoxin|uniref:thioredoxin family protein n=1 Tax=Chryseobacterium sp. TaxID=1871047 RepID=UPI00282F198A|nr:thioredoxin family protein [Chryseobacterium sp.]MDR2236444.1 thioredoxin family protein [Chryseobacterium sp.]
MKSFKIILIASLLLFQFGKAQEKADLVLNKALAQARTEHKNVLLVFHASWCGWCKLMEKNMNLPETKPIFDKNFVTAYIDVQERGEKKKLENPGGQELMNSYKGENAGLPFWLIIGPKGDVLTNSFDDRSENLGSPATPAEVATFLAKLEKNSKMNKDELRVIEKVFVKKEK